MTNPGRGGPLELLKIHIFTSFVRNGGVLKTQGITRNFHKPIKWCIYTLTLKYHLYFLQFAAVKINF